MEKELNIAEILKDKPKGLKLWSPIIGDCELSFINSIFDIIVTVKSKIFYNGSAIYSMDFDSKGKYGGEFEGNTIERECVLFPSKSMRDWSKFAWKKGDVLVSDNNKVFVVYNRFANEDYTMFKIAYVGYKDGNIGSNDSFYNTVDYHKASKEDAKEFIKSIEVQFGGKLNLETLEIEKPQFKDGDIVSYGGCSAICKKLDGETLYFYASTTEFGLLFDNNINSSFQYRPAKEEEKQQLFSALEKNGKAWDAEKKQIVDLPKKCEFKAFDKVLARDTNDEKWLPKFFSDYDERGIDSYPYGVINSGGESVYYKQCIPYNDQTAHLLGTTDDWKGDNNV